MSVKLVYPDTLEGKKQVQNMVEEYYANIIYQVVDTLEGDLRQKEILLAKMQQLLLVLQEKD